eukprot:6424588-Amphidinium_carterae.1
MARVQAFPGTKLIMMASRWPSRLYRPVWILWSNGVPRDRKASDSSSMRTMQTGQARVMIATQHGCRSAWCAYGVLHLANFECYFYCITCRTSTGRAKMTSKRHLGDRGTQEVLAGLSLERSLVVDLWVQFGMPRVRVASGASRPCRSLCQERYGCMMT